MTSPRHDRRLSHKPLTLMLADERRRIVDLIVRALPICILPSAQYPPNLLDSRRLQGLHAFESSHGFTSVIHYNTMTIPQQW